MATMPGLAPNAPAAGHAIAGRAQPSFARAPVHQLVTIDVAISPEAQLRVTEYFRASGPNDWLARATSAGVKGRSGALPGRHRLQDIHGQGRVRGDRQRAERALRDDTCAEGALHPVVVSEWPRHPRDGNLEAAKDHAAVVPPETERVGQHHVHVQGAGLADDDVEAALGVDVGGAGGRRDQLIDEGQY